MNEKLIELLELPAGATEEQILAAVAELQKEAKANATKSAGEKRIRKKIADSGGALNREQAIMAIEHQDEADAKRKEKK